MPISFQTHTRRRPAFLAAPLATAVATAAGLLAVPASHAQVPGAGTLLQQVTPPANASVSGSAPKVVVEQAPGQAAPAGMAFEVRDLQISGNSVVDTATLQALVADARGQRLNLAQLDRLIGRITAHYRQAGYPLARAIIPAQTIQDGVVRVEVIEARLGAVRVDNRSAVDTGLIERILVPLRTGSVVSQAALDRPLLLISDLPGVAPSAVIRAGSTVGTSDLDLRVAAGPAWAGHAELDNEGNRYTGRVRASAGAALFNPMRQGDVASASLLTSGHGLRSGRLAYATPVGGAGTRVQAGLSALRYALGDTAADLQAHGDASGAQLSVSHPLRRATDWNLRVEAQGERLTLRDRVDATGLRSDRRLDLLTLRLAGDAADLGGSGAQAAWLASLVGGRLHFDDAGSATSDAASAGTAGGFSKVEGQVLLTRAVAPGATLAVSLRGQQAQGNLDASQKFSLGGPGAVRAYEAGSLSGDSGALVSAEWRQALPVGAPGAWQAMAFIDSGRVTINHTPWRAGTNTASLHGGGVGLSWSDPSAWQARLALAAPFGTAPDIQGLRRAKRVWLDLRKDF